MRQRVEGRVSMLLGCCVERAEVRDGRVHLSYYNEQGAYSDLVTDHVIAATGYQVDCRRFIPEREDSFRVANGESRACAFAELRIVDPRTLLRRFERSNLLRSSDAFRRWRKIHSTPPCKTPQSRCGTVEMSRPPQVHYRSNNKDCDEAFLRAGKRSVVIAGADIAALGMSRSLSMEGIPVIVVDRDPMLPGMHSRSAKPYLVRDIVGPTLIDGLLALRARLDHRPLLFLRSDAQVRTISADRARLEQAFQIRLPQHECLCDLLDKRKVPAACGEARNFRSAGSDGSRGEGLFET